MINSLDHIHRDPNTLGGKPIIRAHVFVSNLFWSTFQAAGRMSRFLRIIRIGDRNISLLRSRMLRVRSMTAT